MRLWCRAAGLGVLALCALLWGCGRDLMTFGVAVGSMNSPSVELFAGNASRFLDRIRWLETARRWEALKIRAHSLSAVLSSTPGSYADPCATQSAACDRCMSGDVVTGQLDLACWTALAGSSTTLVGAFQMEVSEIRSTEGQGYIRWWDVCHAQNQKKAEGEGALCFNGFTGYESKTNTDNTEASYYSVVWAVRLWVYEGNQEPVRLDGAVGTVFSQKQGPISIRREAVFLEDRSLLYRNYTFTQTSGEVFGEGKVEIKAANGLFSCNFKVSSGTKTGSCTRLESKICEVSPGVPCEPAQISW